MGVAENQINCRNFLLHPGKQWVRARSTRRRIGFEKSTGSKRRKGQGDVVNIEFGSLDSSQAICPLPLPWGSNHHVPNRPPAPSDRGFIFQLGRYFVSRHCHPSFRTPLEWPAAPASSCTTSSDAKPTIRPRFYENTMNT